jgi:hypothetical protein
LYSVAKTVADCFIYGNKIGLDVACYEPWPSHLSSVWRTPNGRPVKDADIGMDREREQGTKITLTTN